MKELDQVIFIILADFHRSTFVKLLLLWYFKVCKLKIPLTNYCPLFSFAESAKSRSTTLDTFQNNSRRFDI